ncbi:MAG TPA: lysylphosphatidylglycerol synthase transmembrane domain-containing protein [Acidimicrobiales bacterium]
MGWPDLEDTSPVAAARPAFDPAAGIDQDFDHDTDEPAEGDAAEADGGETGQGAPGEALPAPDQAPERREGRRRGGWLARLRRAGAGDAVTTGDDAVTTGDEASHADDAGDPDERSASVAADAVAPTSEDDDFRFGAGAPEAEPGAAAPSAAPPQAPPQATSPDLDLLAPILAEEHPVETEVAPRRRVRSAGDVLRLLAGLALVGIGLSVAAWAKSTVGGVEEDVTRNFARLPDRVEEALAGSALVISAALPLAASIVLILRRRYVLTASLALAVSVAAWVMDRLGDVLADRGLITDQSGATAEVDLGSPGFATSPLIASTVAIVIIVSPRLTIRWRRVFWAAVALLVVMRIVGASAPPLDVLIALGVGMVVGALALVAVGAPSLDPDGPALTRMLREAHIHPTRIVQMHATGGVLTYRVWRADQPTLILRLRTPHDRSADLLERLWRRIRYRTTSPGRPFSSMRRLIEREALALTVARTGGVRVPGLEGVVGDSSGTVGLALEDTNGRPLSALSESELTDDVLDAAWRQLGLLHWRRIAHRELDLDRIEVDPEGRTWLVGMDRAAVAAGDRDLSRDVAQLLVDVALAVGPDRAVRTAERALGSEAISNALPYLQPLALPPTTRSAARRDRAVLEETRARAAEVTGTPEVELARLDRVSTRTVVTVAAVGLAFYVLLPQLGDLERTADAFQDAHWGWVPLMVGAQGLTYLFAAVSLMGSVPSPLRFWPTVRAQIATEFVGRITPGSTGGLALGVRYLQRSGMDPAAATASVGLNAVGGLTVHLSLMIAFFAWTGTSGIGGFSLPDANLILAGVAAVLSVGGAILVARPLRERLVGPVVSAARSAYEALSGVASNPLRVLQLVLGSIGVTVANIAALVATIQGFGGGLSFPQIGAAYLGATALASASPTPGGLGAFEAALITALSGFGMDDGAAVSSVLSFRLVTYWLPTLPGWVAFHWMERNGEL